MVCRQIFCSSKVGAKNSLGWYLDTFSFESGRSLYKFLKYSVAQLCFMKPLTTVTMLVLKLIYPDDSNKYHMLRVVDILILLVALQPLLQLYSAALPRLRGLGGDKVFLLLAIVVVVIFIQELTTAIVCIEYVLEWNLSQDYVDTIQIASVKYVTYFTIFQYTIFSNMFYRFFVPEIFEGAAATLWAGDEEKVVMSSGDFVQEVFSLWRIFDAGRSWDTMPRTNSWKSLANGAAAEDSAEENGPAEEQLAEETTKLL